MMAREAVAGELESGPEVRGLRTVEASAPTCDRCATSGRERAAAARCRFCALALCSEHLAEELRPEQSVASLGCRHIYVAAGWLARALRS